MVQRAVGTDRSRTNAEDRFIPPETSIQNNSSACFLPCFNKTAKRSSTIGVQPTKAHTKYPSVVVGISFCSFPKSETKHKYTKNIILVSFFPKVCLATDDDDDDANGIAKSFFKTSSRESGPLLPVSSSIRNAIHFGR